jgi:hypothetical protein
MTSLRSSPSTYYLEFSKRVEVKLSFIATNQSNIIQTLTSENHYEGHLPSRWACGLCHRHAFQSAWRCADFGEKCCFKATAKCYTNLATTVPVSYGHIDSSCTHDYLRCNKQCTHPRFEPEPIPPHNRTTKIHTKTNLARQIFVVPDTTLSPSHLVDGFDIPKYTTSFAQLVASPIAKHQHGFEPELEHAPGPLVGGLEKRKHGFDVNDPLNASPAPAFPTTTSFITSTRTRTHTRPTHWDDNSKQAPQGHAHAKECNNSYVSCVHGGTPGSQCEIVCKACENVCITKGPAACGVCLFDAVPNSPPDVPTKSSA